MLVGHVFDFALVLRSRRRGLRLRQDDLARKVGLSRGFISDLEHGKPTVEFGKVLRVMEALAVPMSIGWNEEPPGWTKPFIRRAQAADRRFARARPRGWRDNPRPDPQGPDDWYRRADQAETKAWLEHRSHANDFWDKEQLDRFVKNACESRARDAASTADRAATAIIKGYAPELAAARQRIVRAITARSQDEGDQRLHIAIRRRSSRLVGNLRADRRRDQP